MTEPSSANTVADADSGSVSPSPQPAILKPFRAIEFVGAHTAMLAAWTQRCGQAVTSTLPTLTPRGRGDHLDPAGMQHASMTPQPVPKNGNLSANRDHNEADSDGDDDDVTRLWRIVDELTAELSDGDCRAIYTAIATGVADGWRPTRSEIANLVAFAKQQAIAAQHHRQSENAATVVRSATASGIT